jgi:hypothetical protein
MKLLVAEGGQVFEGGRVGIPIATAVVHEQAQLDALCRA